MDCCCSLQVFPVVPRVHTLHSLGSLFPKQTCFGQKNMAPKMDQRWTAFKFWRDVPRKNWYSNEVSLHRVVTEDQFYELHSCVPKFFLLPQVFWLKKWVPQEDPNTRPKGNDMMGRMMPLRGETSRSVIFTARTPQIHHKGKHLFFWFAILSGSLKTLHFYECWMIWAITIHFCFEMMLQIWIRISVMWVTWLFPLWLLQ